MRCGPGPDPRVETVHFPEAPPGRYRVGLDFPARCDGSSDPVAFAVALEHGSHVETRSGIVHPREFLTIVLEHHVPAPD